MVRKGNLVEAYKKATSDKKVEIIISNYNTFIGTIDGYTEGLKYKIESDQAVYRRSQKGDLGVRVRGGCSLSDPTANTAIKNITMREAIVNCDFDEDFFEGIDHPEGYIQDAWFLYNMRRDFKLFNEMLAILGDEKEEFVMIISGKKKIDEVAEERGIAYDSAVMRINRAKRKVKSSMLVFLDEGGAA